MGSNIPIEDLCQQVCYAMIRKARDSRLDTLRARKRQNIDVSGTTATESNIQERHVWPTREAFGWRAVILALTNDSLLTASGRFASLCVALQ